MKIGKFDYTNVLGFDVLNAPFADFLQQVMEGPRGAVAVNTISPNSYGIATKDPVFCRALANSVLILDGVYFALASLIHGKGGIVKNQGPTISRQALEYADKHQLRVFFFGSLDATLNKIRSHLQQRYPRAAAGFYAPPFKPELDEEDCREARARINAFCPDILFVGMTCPKQEKWLVQNIEHLDIKIGLSVGAVFDWLAGNYKEIAPLWWRLNLGWLVRAIQRPQLIARNTPNYWIFFRHMIRSVGRKNANFINNAK